MVIKLGTRAPRDQSHELDFPISLQGFPICSLSVDSSDSLPYNEADPS